MKTNFVLTFLGAMPKIGTKSQKEYQVAKFIDESTEDVFEFFVNERVKAKIDPLKKYKPYTVTINITTRQGDIEVGIDDVQGIGAAS